MILPIREQKERAIAVLLRTIVAGQPRPSPLPFACDPNYLTTPIVKRSLLHIDQCKELLASSPTVLGVGRSSESARAWVLSDPGESGAWDDEHVIAITGYVHGDHERLGDESVVLANDLSNRLEEDVVACLINQMLGGLLSQAMTPIEKLLTDNGEREPQAIFRQFWTAISD